MKEFLKKEALKLLKRKDTKEFLAASAVYVLVAGLVGLTLPYAYMGYCLAIFLTFNKPFIK